MSIQAVTATRLGTLPAGISAASGDTPEQALGLAPDQLSLSTPMAPTTDVRAQGGVLDWFVGVIDVLFGGGRGRYDYGDPYGGDPYGGYPYGGYPDNRRYPMPGQIPPETSYGRQLMSVLDNYDRQMEMLNQQYYRMPNQAWARRERNLWEQTCEQIVRSYAPRDEKLAALGHVHNSSSMPGSAYQEYARQVGGYSRY